MRIISLGHKIRLICHLTVGVFSKAALIILKLNLEHSPLSTYADSKLLKTNEGFEVYSKRFKPQFYCGKRNLLLPPWSSNKVQTLNQSNATYRTDKIYPRPTQRSSVLFIKTFETCELDQWGEKNHSPINRIIGALKKTGQEIFALKTASILHDMDSTLC